MVAHGVGKGALRYCNRWLQQPAPARRGAFPLPKMGGARSGHAFKRSLSNSVCRARTRLRRPPGAVFQKRNYLTLYLTLQSGTGPRADYTPSTEIPSHTRIMFVSPKR